jgi:hypothetical protein
MVAMLDLHFTHSIIHTQSTSHSFCFSITLNCQLETSSCLINRAMSSEPVFGLSIPVAQPSSSSAPPSSDQTSPSTTTFGIALPSASNIPVVKRTPKRKRLPAPKKVDFSRELDEDDDISDSEIVAAPTSRHGRVDVDVDSDDAEDDIEDADPDADVDADVAADMDDGVDGNADVGVAERSISKSTTLRPTRDGFRPQLGKGKKNDVDESIGKLGHKRRGNTL